MSGSFRSHLTRTALLCSAVLLAPLAMADTPAPATSATQPAVIPAPAAAPSREQSRDEMRARRHADHEAFFSARLAALHAGLQLKPEQEALWTPVETAIRDFAKLRAARWAQHNADGRGSDATTDTLKAQGDRLIARGNAMKSLADATGPLVGGLDADQKSRLPMLLEGLHPKRVLARAFALDDRRDDREAWHHGEREHDGWGHGMRHEHWAERDEKGDRFDRDEDGRGFRHHHRGWDDERAQRDDRHDDDFGRGERPPTHHHHDQDEDGPDRT